jgi:hypothetical protein
MALRGQQTQFIGQSTARLLSQCIDFCTSGDFDELEFCPTLQALIEDPSTNLLERVPSPLLFDYNPRGLSQALMHDVVANRQLQGRTARKRFGTTTCYSGHAQAHPEASQAITPATSHA